MRIELILALMVAGLGMWAAGSVAMAAEVVRATPQDLEVVRGRLLASLVHIPESQLGKIGSASRWMSEMQPDGSWTDQDYSDTNRERWKCGGHLPRVLDLAMAGRHKSVAPEKQAQFIAAAVKALRFWLSADPTNTNWWHNEIGVPLQVGNALIILGDDAPEDLRQRGIELMKRSRWEKWTGQNLVWGTRIQIIRACVAGDVVAAIEAFGRMYEEVRIAAGRAEGIKPDWSFYQHGELLYSGGYGAAFTADTSRLALLARETALAIPQEKLEILVSHLLDGQAWMTRGHYWDYSATGREIVRKGKNARSLATPARDLAVLYPKRSEELLALAARLDSGDTAAPALSGNRHFWFSDYMTHHRPEWFASARMYSARTKNTDPLINGESRKSHYLAEGATYIMHRGGEYEDIFPVWDWHKIPGTTVEQETPFDPKQVSRIGTQPFVGGVSEGRYGCATMDLATGQLRAKKSWFFFDEGFIALGAGINCDTDSEVATTLNQCLLNGAVTMPPNADPVARGDHRAGVPWFWHARVGYVPLDGAAVHLRSDKQQGSWSEINSGASAEPVVRDVFLAYYDHGRRPADAQYAYLVLPATTAEQTAAAAQDPPMKVLSNTLALQAVRHEKLGMTQAIFREPGRVQCGEFLVSVDRPCALLVRQQGDEITFTASNPGNEPADLTILVSARLNAPGAAEQSSGQTRLEIHLPDGSDAGRSVSRNARMVR